MFLELRPRPSLPNLPVDFVKHWIHTFPSESERRIVLIACSVLVGDIVCLAIKYRVFQALDFDRHWPVSLDAQQDVTVYSGEKLRVWIGILMAPAVQGCVVVRGSVHFGTFGKVTKSRDAASTSLEQVLPLFLGLIAHAGVSFVIERHDKAGRFLHELLVPLKLLRVFPERMTGLPSGIEV